jgi:hypothetical protein
VQSRRSTHIVRVNCLNQLDQPKEVFLCAHARLTTPVNTQMTKCPISRSLVRTEKRLEGVFPLLETTAGHGGVPPRACWLL